MNDNQDNLVTTLLETADKYKQQKLGCDEHGDYVYWSPFCPPQQIPVGAHLEPVVPVDAEWGLNANVILTINHYNALVLNSKNLLMVDVDFGVARLNKWKCGGLQHLMHYMQDLAYLDGNNTENRWSDQTWRVYTTANGARVICTSKPFPLEDRQNCIAFGRLCGFLQGDPLYCQKCMEQKCYRARLTPKAHEYDRPVCCYGGTLWEEREAHPDLVRQLALHDAVTSYVGGTIADAVLGVLASAIE